MELGLRLLHELRQRSRTSGKLRQVRLVKKARVGHRLRQTDCEHSGYRRLRTRKNRLNASHFGRRPVLTVQDRAERARRSAQGHDLARLGGCVAMTTLVTFKWPHAKLLLPRCARSQAHIVGNFFHRRHCTGASNSDFRL